MMPAPSSDPPRAPRDVETERSVLFAALTNPAEAWPLLREHGPDLFAGPAHRAIAEVVFRRLQANEPVEFFQVRNDLEDAGQKIAARTVLELHRNIGAVADPAQLVARLAAMRDVRGSAPASRIKLVRAVDVVEEPVEWLIPGFVARGELTDLSGDPGVGKGSILASWAARVTSTSDASVLFFSTEDRLGHVKARLRAEGADLARVHLLDIREANTSPVLPDDIGLVEEIVRNLRAALVAFDPALEFMDPALDSHRQQDVQRFAAAIGGMAQRTRAAALTVRHLNKATGVSAVYKGAGSIGFVARARMALLAAKDKEHDRRVLTVVKGNIGKDTSAVEFDIVERQGSTVVTWGEAAHVTADELVNQEPRKRRGPTPAKLEAACDVLRAMLTQGAMTIDDVLRCARSEGIGRSTVYEAARALKVNKCTVNLRTGWRLPSGETPDGHLVKSEPSGVSTLDNRGQEVTA